MLQLPGFVMNNMNISWKSMKPSFSASKVATLIGLNPFQPSFPEVFQLMGQMDVPLCYEGTAQRPAEKVALENHLLEIVKPHITPSTTVEDLHKLEKNLGVLGPLGPQAAQAARMRFGQVAEEKTIQNLKQTGEYGEGQYMKGDFKHFFLTGKTDGTYNGKIVEIKNRKKRFLGITSYERPQFECYMRLFGVTELYLCEMLKKETGTEQRLVLVHSDEKLWSLIMQRLTWVSQFIEEVQERPFLQELHEDLLETHYHQFMEECQTNL